MKKIIGLLMVAGGLTACSEPDYGSLNAMAQSALVHSEKMMAEGKTEEGVKMLLPVKDLHQDDTRVKDLIAKLPEDRREELLEGSALGFNKSHRTRIEGGVARIFWYVPDRIFDVFDIFSFDANIGPQVGVGVWATRAVNVEAYAGMGAGVGLFQKRNFGVISESSARLSVGPVGPTYVSGARAGTGGMDSCSDGFFLHTPYQPLYQEYRDYYAVGAQVGVGLVGVYTEVHLVEIVDFILGVFCIDFANDDLGCTRSLQFNEAEKSAYKSLVQAIADLDEDEMATYRSKFPHLN